MSDVLHDGDFTTPQQHGRIVTQIDPVSRMQTWRQTLIQLAENWEALPLDSAGPDGGYLVEETETQHLGAGLYQWDRIFKSVPARHRVASSGPYVFPKPALTGDELTEASIPTTFITLCDYTLTSAPERIPLARKPVFLSASDLLSVVGPYLDGTLIVADDSKVERIHGNLYCRKTMCVTKETLLAAYYSVLTPRTSILPVVLPPILP